MARDKKLQNGLFAHHAHILSTTADFSRRTIYLYGEIDDAASYRFSVAIQMMDQLDGDITVNLSSPGGSVEDGFAIFDAIKMVRNRVIIVGYGPIMSMASVIMQAGDLRLMSPESRFMIHDGGAGMEGFITSLKFAAVGKEMGEMVNRIVRVLSARTGLKEKKVLRLMNEETHMTAKEALDAGFIDGIAISDKYQKELNIKVPAEKPAPKRRARPKAKTKKRTRRTR